MQPHVASIDQKQKFQLLNSTISLLQLPTFDKIDPNLNFFDTIRIESDAHGGGLLSPTTVARLYRLMQQAADIFPMKSPHWVEGFHHTLAIFPQKRKIYVAEEDSIHPMKGIENSETQSHRVLEIQFSPQSKASSCLSSRLCVYHHNIPLWESSLLEAYSGLNVDIIDRRIRGKSYVVNIIREDGVSLDTVCNHQKIVISWRTIKKIFVFTIFLLQKMHKDGFAHRAVKQTNVIAINLFREAHLKVGLIGFKHTRRIIEEDQDAERQFFRKDIAALGRLFLKICQANLNKLKMVDETMPLNNAEVIAPDQKLKDAICMAINACYDSSYKTSNLITRLLGDPF